MQISRHLFLFFEGSGTPILAHSCKTMTQLHKACLHRKQGSVIQKAKHKILRYHISGPVPGSRSELSDPATQEFNHCCICEAGRLFSEENSNRLHCEAQMQDFSFSGRLPNQSSFYCTQCTTWSMPQNIKSRKTWCKFM